MPNQEKAWENSIMQSDIALNKYRLQGDAKSLPLSLSSSPITSTNSKKYEKRRNINRPNESMGKN